MKQLRSWNWYKVALGSFALAFLVYLIIIPSTNAMLESFRPQETASSLEETTLADQIQLRVIKAVVGALFFFLGATIGSFMNVVVYRLPRGMSVISQRSSCPHCRASIKGRDNIPIFGWLLLSGRCRNCNAPISLRYPIVESIVAGIFLLLFFVELISGGANIPVRPPNTYGGVVWIIFYTKWDLVSLYFFHCFALCVLVTWALIDVDRAEKESLNESNQPTHIPWWALLLTTALIFTPPILQPDLLPVPWLGETWLGESWLGETGLAETHKSFANSTRLATGAIGGLTGLLLGWLVSITIVERDRKHTASAGLLAGLTLGWQAIIGVWLLTMLFRLAASGAARIGKFREPPMTSILLFAFLLTLCVWRWLTVPWWPSYETAPASWFGIAAAFLLLWLLNRSVPEFAPAIVAEQQSENVDYAVELIDGQQHVPAEEQ